ncbi:MAG TPA: outer membrane lipoprotein carrier protein LolA [Thermoanaerobaculia bacterium]|jgi:outer membrane lipoprotein-sorting protein|nr:outer membrane lipoprotein carrier protein LolA [Thermoanaerobaculia bacterium]
MSQSISIRKFFALALGVAALSLPAVAAPKAPKADSLDDVIQKVQLAQNKTNTLQADFRQEKTLALMAKPEVSTGRFVYSKPNNVLWTYDAPKRVTMLIANGMLTTYYPDLNKAERIEVKRYQDRIFKYMGASGAIDELGAWFNFTFTNTSDKPYYTLDLDPKSKTIAKRIRHIRIYIDKTSYLTTQFDYTEGDGDKTRYEFTNVKVNAPIEQSRFTLQLPSSVRVEQMKLQ